MVVIIEQPSQSMMLRYKSLQTQIVPQTAHRRVSSPISGRRSTRFVITGENAYQIGKTQLTLHITMEK